MTAILATSATLVIALFVWILTYGRQIEARDKKLDALAIIAHSQLGRTEKASIFQLASSGPVLSPYIEGPPTFLDHMLSVTDEYAQARAWIAEQKAQLHQIEQRMLREIDLSFDALARFGGYPGGMIELDGHRLQQAVSHSDDPHLLSALSDCTKEIPHVPTLGRGRRIRRISTHRNTSDRRHPVAT